MVWNYRPFNLNQLVDDKFPIHHVGISYNYLNQEIKKGKVFSRGMPWRIFAIRSFSVWT
jgi:hypothetical protein